MSSVSETSVVEWFVDVSQVADRRTEWFVDVSSVVEWFVDVSQAAVEEADAITKQKKDKLCVCKVPTVCWTNCVGTIFSHELMEEL